MNFLRFFVRLDSQGIELFEKEISIISGNKGNMGLDELILEKERAEARAEGIEKGVRKRDIEIILSMNEDGFEIPRITKITKLSIEHVEKILKENRKNG